MAKYFFDTEFHEGKHKPLFGRERHFIELISIGIVSEDGREYYAISNEFDFDAAWYAWQPRVSQGGLNDFAPKEYWLRENVIRKIWLEYIGGIHKEHLFPFTYRNMKRFFKKSPFSGCKSNAQIANEIIEFIYGKDFCDNMDGMGPLEVATKYECNDKSLNPEFYAYYADYDWVVFCQALFGKMKDLPKGFPMYCRDIKQMFDQRLEDLKQLKFDVFVSPANNGGGFRKGITSINPPKDISDWDLATKLQFFKELPTYPKESNAHNALADAKWNLELFKFLQTF